MESFNFLYRYIGPAIWGLLPISIITLGLLFHIFFSIWQKIEISEWVEILLAHFKETATLLGLLGSVYALTNSFQVEGASPEEIRTRMFFIMSTGFWSTICGVLVSLECGLGLLAMKRI